MNIFNEIESLVDNRNKKVNKSNNHSKKTIISSRSIFEYTQYSLNRIIHSTIQQNDKINDPKYMQMYKNIENILNFNSFRLGNHVFKCGTFKNLFDGNIMCVSNNTMVNIEKVLDYLKDKYEEQGFKSSSWDDGDEDDNVFHNLLKVSRQYLYFEKLTTLKDSEIDVNLHEYVYTDISYFKKYYAKNNSSLLNLLSKVRDNKCLIAVAIDKKARDGDVKLVSIINVIENNGIEYLKITPSNNVINFSNGEITPDIEAKFYDDINKWCDKTNIRLEREVSINKQQFDFVKIAKNIITNDKNNILFKMINECTKLELGQIGKKAYTLELDYIRQVLFALYNFYQSKAQKSEKIETELDLPYIRTSFIDDKIKLVNGTILSRQQLLDKILSKTKEYSNVYYYVKKINYYLERESASELFNHRYKLIISNNIQDVNYNKFDGNIKLNTHRFFDDGDRGISAWWGYDYTTLPCQLTAYLVPFNSSIKNYDDVKNAIMKWNTSVLVSLDASEIEDEFVKSEYSNVHKKELINDCYIISVTQKLYNEKKMLELTEFEDINKESDFYRSFIQHNNCEILQEFITRNIRSKNIDLLEYAKNI